MLIIPPPQPHWGAQCPGEGGELDVAPQATERLAPEILADHGPVGRGTGITQREQDHVGQEHAAPVPGGGQQGEGGRPRQRGPHEHGGFGEAVCGPAEQQIQGHRQEQLRA